MSTGNPAYLPRETVCPAGVWTQVIGAPVAFAWTLRSVPTDPSSPVNGVVIQWRRYSDLPPFYTFGDWVVDNANQLEFVAVTAGLYCGFDFCPNYACKIINLDR